MIVKKLRLLEIIRVLCVSTVSLQNLYVVVFHEHIYEKRRSRFMLCYLGQDAED